MSLNPFEAATSYSSMLNKIAFATFVVSLGALIFVNTLLGGLPAWAPAILVKTTFKLPEIDVQISLAFGIVAVIFAWLTRHYKLHDLLSDLFGIRERFDIDCILLPMAGASGAALSLEQQRKLREQRHELMRKAFYKYASSSPESPDRIEQHAITMALDQWSSYWILVEAAFVLFGAAVVLAVRHKFGAALVMSTLILAIIWLLQSTRKQCRDYARDEIQQILDKPSRRDAVREVFSAL